MHHSQGPKVGCPPLHVLRRNRQRRLALAITICSALTSCSSNAVPLSVLPTPPFSLPASTHGEYAGYPGRDWTLTWSDSFRTLDALKDWTFMDSSDGWGNQELQLYDSSNVSLGPSGLVITATQDGHGKKCWYGPCRYSSSSLETKGLFEQEYGLFEARIKIPTGRGLWPAFWMVGADIDHVQWPNSGEIDIIEVNNEKPGLVEGFAHTGQRNYGAYFQTSSSLSAGYHIYGIDWTPQGITWIVDGRAFGWLKAYPGWPFSQPFFIILDLAVGGNWPGSPDASTKFPAEMDISWIRVYKNKEL